MSFAIAAHHCELFHRKAVSFSLKKIWELFHRTKLLQRIGQETSKAFSLFKFQLCLK